VTAPKHQEAKQEASEEDPRSNEEKLNHALRDAKLKHLESLRKWPTKDQHATLLKELLAEFPKHIPLLQANIQAAEAIKSPDENKEQELSRHQGIVAAADMLLAAVDLNGLAAHLGRRVDKENAEAVRVGKEWDKARDAVVDALSRKVVANERRMRLGDGDDAAGQAAAAYKALSAWVDPSESKHDRVTAAYERAAGRLGLALAAVNRLIGEEKPPKKESLEERASLLDALGWSSWAEYERQALIVKFPKLYARF
jgi:hypothetical protein